LRIEPQAAAPQPSQARPGPGAAQQRVQPAAELAVAERLDQIVVSATFEAADAIELPSATAEDEHGQLGVQAPAAAGRRADLAEELEPVSVGQPQVDDRELRRAGRDQPQALGGGGGLDRLITVGGEVVGQETPRDAVVLYDEDGWSIRLHIDKSLEPDPFHPPLAATSNSGVPAEQDSPI